MKNILLSFVVGVAAGTGLLYLYLNQKTPLEVAITQEKGIPIEVISNTLDKKSTLTTTLYSESTGTIILTQKIPPPTGWYLRFALMPNYLLDDGFGLGGLIGMEYRTGRMGYFMDVYYDPFHNQGGMSLGISIKIF